MEILGLEQVGIYDSFLELGGHSLNAVQIISRVQTLFGVELSIRSFFDSTTIATMANQIEQITSADDYSVI
jgi:acyl carrier protein